MEPAMIYALDGSGTRDPHRDSDNMVVTPMAEDLVIQAINTCIAEATGTGYGWGEPLHVLRYRPGQQYRPHHDALAQVPLEKRRLATALIYLNDAYEGGETHFPEIGMTVRGAVGDLLIFHNLTADGMPDPRMTHAGLPVGRGEKWLATRWIRPSDYFGRSATGR
jgi:prolyl 4-hydroxylase